MGNTEPRRFYLVRHEDPTGISGTGTVAEGVQFTDGWCALRWRTEWTSTVIYSSIEHVKNIHSHGGKTEIVWIDHE